MLWRAANQAKFLIPYYKPPLARSLGDVNRPLVTRARA